jgi:hypothetical protein
MINVGAEEQGHSPLTAHDAGQAAEHGRDFSPPVVRMRPSKISLTVPLIESELEINEMINSFKNLAGKICVFATKTLSKIQWQT